MANQTDEAARRAELEAELEEERLLKARVHRHMGMSAAILVLVAIAVALYRIPAMFGPIVGAGGISPWAALGIGSTTIPWILLIIGITVLLSMGTTRLMGLLERIVTVFKGKESRR